MADTPVFPDILGTITGGARVNIHVIQAALGVHPGVVQAGKPFELLLLLQNASDRRVDVTAALHLPRQFRGKSSRVTVGLAAGEAGYVTVPVAALPGTDAGSYKLGAELEVKAHGKPNRVREATGGEPAHASTVRGEKVRLMAALRRVEFSTSKRLIGTVLEVGVEVGTAAKDSPSAQQAGWTSLWSMADFPDDRAILRYYGDTMRHAVLPQLKREQTLLPLASITEQRFENAGYPLKPVEALMVAKLMALILEYAAPREHIHDPIQAGRYDLTPVLAGSEQAAEMPRWARGMLRLVARDERAAAQAATAVTRMLYDDLLFDAMMLAFALVETATGEDVGSEGEMREYAARLLNSLNTRGELDFVHVYMPLILGGIVINDKVTTEDTNVVEALRELWTLLDERRHEADESGQPVVEIAEQLIERALQAYGYRRGST